MASVEDSIHLPPLEAPHEREEVGRELQTVLHELINPSLNGKQLDWAVVGPGSRPLHLFLDEIVDSWRELADTVAERAVALGIVPDGQTAAGSPRSQLSSVRQAALGGPPGCVGDDSSGRRRRRPGARTPDAVGNLDLVSQDVLVEVVRELEKQQWLLRVQLGERTQWQASAVAAALSMAMPPASRQCNIDRRIPGIVRWADTARQAERPEFHDPGTSRQAALVDMGGVSKPAA